MAHGHRESVLRYVGLGSRSCDPERCYTFRLVDAEDGSQSSYGFGLGRLTEVPIVHFDHAGIAVTQLLSDEDQGNSPVDETRGVGMAEFMEDHRL